MQLLIHSQTSCGTKPERNVGEPAPGWLREEFKRAEERARKELASLYIEHKGVGDRLTASDVNTIVSRLDALERVIRNPDYWEAYVQGFEAGKASK